MPFTLAHPAAVLPLLRPPFSASALIAGAVAPDVPYFIRATSIPVSAGSWYEPFTNATTSHSLAGLVPVDLPIALALHLCLLAAVAPAAALLGPPRGPAVRPAAGRGGSSAMALRWAWIVLSLLIGVLTHLVWDSFTHPDGYVVSRLDLLSETTVGDLTWARLVQHLSTAVGLLVLGVAAWHRRARVTGADRSARRRLTLVVMAGVLAASLGALLTTRPWGSADAGQTIEGMLADAALGAGLGAAAILALGTAAWWTQHAPAHRTPDRD